MPEYTVVKLLPLHYVHIRDINKNIVKVVTGPRTFTCEEFEEVVLHPTKMISIPPDHYVVIENPVVRDAKGKVVEGTDGEDKLRYGDEEVRFHSDPFPLYYGELCRGKVSPLPLVKENEGLLLRAKRDISGDDVGYFKELPKAFKIDLTPRKAGESWLFPGPGLYFPRVGVEIVSAVQAKVLKINEALLMRATEDTVDWKGVVRKSGSEWIVRKFGAYMPQVHEEIVRVITGQVIDHKSALHLRAKHTFYVGEDDLVDAEEQREDKDSRKKRLAGEEWLVTRKDSEVYFPGIHEEVVGIVKLKVMTDSDYCIIGDPWDEKKGKVQLGSTRLIRGPQNFFLMPGERIISEKKVRVLRANEALWVTAKEEYVDPNNTKHRPGDEWIVKGPGAFVEPVEVHVKQQMNAIISIWPLDIHIFEAWLVGAIVLLIAVLWYMW